MTLEYFRENICKYCKKQCSKAIVIEEDISTESIKCVDYEKDESKIEGYIRPLEKTAKIQRCVMPRLMSKWE